MASLLFFADSPRAGCGATVRLDSGETCLLSIAPTSVRLRKDRFGLFGRMLYKEKVSYRAALMAQTLGHLFPDSLLPAEFPGNPVLRAFTNAILHCPSCSEVNRMLEAVSDYTERQAGHDRQVIADFSACMAQDKLRASVFHDVSVLPHPKETILGAIEREILREQLAAKVEWLKESAAMLPCFQRDLARSGLEIVKAESDDIAARIEAAVCLRNARKPWPPPRA